jgi:hypothetical protein
MNQCSCTLHFKAELLVNFRHALQVSIISHLCKLVQAFGEDLFNMFFMLATWFKSLTKVFGYMLT